MYRGSTPKFIFPVTFDVNKLADFVLTFEQGDSIILQKTLEDCEVYTDYDVKKKKSVNKIAVRLTVEESFMFEPARQLHIQLRALLEDDLQLVTNEIETYVYDTLYKGELPTEEESS